MEKLSSDDAINLLINDVISCEEDYFKPENKWVLHCIYVGEAAGRIACKLGLDEDKARALGYVHDIGRKINHKRHVLEGYYYMQDKGYEDESIVCLTHSFVNNDFFLVAGGEIDIKRQFLFEKYLLEHPCTIYDNIVQMCDLFCLESGFTTVEKRLLDIYRRKGIFSNTEAHFESVMNLKCSLEGTMGCSLYSLFPEISRKDLDNIDSDHEALVNLLCAAQKKYEKN